MKKAVWLAGVFLCTTGVFASETRNDLGSEGKKRNEEAYERTLEQTGWKKEKISQEQKRNSPGARDHLTEATQPKSI